MRMMLIDLDGKRTEREETGALPTPPAVIMHDNRPYVRRLGHRAGKDVLVYQEVTCSHVRPYSDSQRHPREEDCVNAETENANLRAILADVAGGARVRGDGALMAFVETRLSRRLPLEEGGVTENSAEEERAAIRELMEAAGKLADMSDEVASGVEVPSAAFNEQCRTVRNRITEVEAVLPPTLHEARGKP